ncbi:MAG TPA: glycosyltransferase family 1 protein, partial [Pedobacter sp.]
SHFFTDSFQNKNAFLIKCSWVLRPYLPRKLKRKSKTLTIALLEKQEFDLFIPTYYDPYFLAHIKDKPYVLTVHDMIHELYPHYFTDSQVTIPNKKILIENATKIIAVSDNTKRDIIRIYPDTDPGKIEVVYLAHTPKNDPLLKLNVPEKYILFVGNRSVYKNFLFFLKAVSSILLERTDLYIFCAGGNSFTEEELASISDLDLTGRVLQQNFEEDELLSYYKKALFFVFPSEYEGFGIPVLESMSAGCPVVLTNNSSFPEVAGNAGIYFELNNPDDLRKQVNDLLDKPELREKYRLKGIEQAGKFSWEKTAEATIKVYQEAISKHTH